MRTVFSKLIKISPTPPHPGPNKDHFSHYWVNRQNKKFRDLRIGEKFDPNLVGPFPYNTVITQPNSKNKWEIPETQSSALGCIPLCTTHFSMRDTDKRLLQAGKLRGRVSGGFISPSMKGTQDSKGGVLCYKACSRKIPMLKFNVYGVGDWGPLGSPKIMKRFLQKNHAWSQKAKRWLFESSKLSAANYYHFWYTVTFFATKELRCMSVPPSCRFPLVLHD